MSGIRGTALLIGGPRDGERLDNWDLRDPYITVPIPCTTISLARLDDDDKVRPECSPTKTAIYQREEFWEGRKRLCVWVYRPDVSEISVIERLLKYYNPPKPENRNIGENAGERLYQGIILRAACENREIPDA